MHPFVALMRTYCIDYTNSHDQTLYDQIMEPDYVLHTMGFTLSGRDEAYSPAVTQVFKDSYAYVGQQNTKVSAFGWATNDDSMPSGLNDAFYAASQALFSSDDIAGQMSKLDAAWATATK